MPATLEAGTINGYCVGEPWNQQAIFKRVGTPILTDVDLWKNNPDKVFGATTDAVFLPTSFLRRLGTWVARTRGRVFSAGASKPLPEEGDSVPPPEDPEHPEHPEPAHVAPESRSTPT